MNARGMPSPSRARNLSPLTDGLDTSDAQTCRLPNGRAALGFFQPLAAKAERQDLKRSPGSFGPLVRKLRASAQPVPTTQLLQSERKSYKCHTSCS
jgi:hypothetical protein